MAKVTTHTIETTVSAPGMLPRQIRIRFNYRHHDRAVIYISCDAHVGGTSAPKKWEAPHPTIAAVAMSWLGEHVPQARAIAREDISDQKRRAA